MHRPRGTAIHPLLFKMPLHPIDWDALAVSDFTEELDLKTRTLLDGLQAHIVREECAATRLAAVHGTRWVSHAW